MDRYLVVGHPIAHSRSPEIHQAFAEQSSQQLTYEKLLATPESFNEQIIEPLRNGQLKGANVTLPFKELAYQLADQPSARVEAAGAANTLYLNEDGALVAENTDGPGLVTDLMEHQGLVLEGKRILMLGAGGAVRGVILSILDANPVELVIANRTESKAKALIDRFDDTRLTTAPLSHLPEGGFDLIINGTSASLSGQLPDLPDHLILASSFAYDMVYGAETTPFCSWAKRLGAQTSDGLGMLVEQAAHSFFLWRGVHPKTGPVLDKLRADLCT